MSDAPDFNPPEFNPYDAPQESERPLLDEASVARTVQLLNETRPWVRFFGGLGIFFAVLMTIGSLIGALVLTSRGQGSVEAIGIVSVYFIFGLLYFVPARHLWRYGRDIAEFSRKPTPDKLNEALAQQKSFWKFIGVAMTIILILYVVILVIGVLGAMIAAVA